MTNFFKRVAPFVMMACLLTSCHDLILDQDPQDKILESDIWESPSAMEAYVVELYTQFPFFEWNGVGGYNHQNSQGPNYSDEATERNGNNNPITTGRITNTNDFGGYWDYEYIRDLNVFLENVADAQVGDGAMIDRLEGEVRVMRAVAYFEMQKRYGGVPLVDVVLDPFDEDIDEKYLIRSSEEEIADFIDTELGAAIALLGEDNSQTGRINKWVAYAYKARANLWSASIAKYGSLHANGYTGIPSNRADEFYEKASEAALAVIESGRYALYNQHPDKAENYRSLFLDNSNSEIIFEKLYDGSVIGHSFSYANYPTRYSTGQGSVVNPLLEFVEGYENIDEEVGDPELGPENLYQDGIEPWKNKDPRLHATVFFQGVPYAGDIIRTYDGLDPSPEPNPDAIIARHDEDYNGTPTVGIDGRLSNNTFVTQSGFLLRKYLIDEPSVDRYTMDTSWKAVRLAEMYLTLAEAQFELGNPGRAAEALNATRERAGLRPLDAETITLEHVRNERKYELAFEGFRYWDLRRWRIAEDVLNRNQPFHGLRIILHYESGQFYFFPMEAENFTRTFRREHYYNPITMARIENNPHLEENPGY